MIVEENPTNFSTEDSINVSIPDALGPIAYEFFPNYIFLLKNLKNLLGIFQCVDVFRRISDLNKEFFKNGHRFCKEIWPELKIILEKIGVNDLNHNLKKKVCIAIFDFIKEIGFFQDEEFCKSSCCGQKKSEICKAFDLLKNKLELQEIS